MQIAYDGQDVEYDSPTYTNDTTLKSVAATAETRVNFIVIN